MLFDSSGNLWVATAYGEDLGEPIDIFEYLAADLTQPNPQAQPNAIVADMYRGDQMAFNKYGNLCIAGFIYENVNCYNPSTGALTQSYYAEIHASSAGVAEPLGLAFDGDNRLYLTSAFTGEVLKEMQPGGPIVLWDNLLRRTRVWSNLRCTSSTLAGTSTCSLLFFTITTEFSFTSNR
ncbi:MAG TPA: hypothetical protein VN924_15555 [Bryobacteraceae bacterium]|jgi:hypothetical protein|nr:hypothetical protein [Bryobacteraceae bacterium]